MLNSFPPGSESVTSEILRGATCGSNDRVSAVDSGASVPSAPLAAEEVRIDSGGAASVREGRVGAVR
jgi:hypothetical protein